MHRVSPGEAVGPLKLSSTFKSARILIVDDEPANVELLKRLLDRHSFSRVESTNDPREAAALYIQHSPDLILLDLHMPHMDGLEVMDRLHQLAEGSYLPILMLTGDLTPESRREALSRGAKDFVNKPFHSDEVLLRIRTLLETRFLYLQIQRQNQDLEAKVKERTQELEERTQELEQRTRELEERTKELEEAQFEIIDRLARAAEHRDDNTGQHTKRVAEMAAVLAQERGLPEATVTLIQRAAPLHDVGKIGVSDEILMKPGRLSEEEFARVREHTSIGARILSGSRNPILKMAEEIALNHHEHWDGNGYNGLKGEAIPLAGRIVAVADVYDALTHERPYKPAWPAGEAIAEIVRQSGRQFDPALVEAFVRVIQAKALT